MLTLTVILVILFVAAVGLHALLLPLSVKTNRWFRLLVVVALFCLLYGLGGFLGSALIAAKTIRLPSDMEWPIVSAQGYVTTPDGINIVPHTPTGRIQLYDQKWKFIRGWNIDAEGGTFLILPAERDRIEVVTERPKRQGWHYSYDLHGKVLSKISLAPKKFEDFVEPRKSNSISTYPWLLPLAHPVGTWALFVIGLSVLAICRKIVNPNYGTRASWSWKW